MTIGERIKHLKGNLSQKDFAEKIGAGSSAICAWENNESLPGSKYLEAIHRVFGVDINWLLTGEGEPYINKDIDVAGGHQFAEHAARYAAAGDPGSAPALGKAVDMLAMVLNSGQQVFIQALVSNLVAFSEAITNHRNQDQRIKLLEDKCEEMKKRIETLEEAATSELKKGMAA